MRLLFALLATAIISGASRAQDLPALPVDNLPVELDLTIPKGLGSRLTLPPDSPMTLDRVALGRRIFFDPILSIDRTVSCASCHQPEHGFASPQAIARGIEGRVGRRNAPTLFNRGFGGRMFWDGRSPSIEDQVLRPISNPDEFGHTLDAVLADLRKDPGYARAFRDAFGGAGEPVTGPRLARALATFVRTLTHGDTPVDRFQSGNHKALTTAERQGLWIFESRGRCWECHSGPNFTDETFHNTGVAIFQRPRDNGRAEFTEKRTDLRRFKTPTLRGVALTAPYMHDGSIRTLKRVVEFYNRGGNGDPALDPRIRPLHLTEESVGHLVAFLEALSRRAKK